MVQIAKIERGISMLAKNIGRVIILALLAAVISTSAQASWFHHNPHKQHHARGYHPRDAKHRT
jgi:hypothetical protein